MNRFNPCWVLVYFRSGFVFIKVLDFSHCFVVVNYIFKFQCNKITIKGNIKLLPVITLQHYSVDVLHVFPNIINKRNDSVIYLIHFPLLFPVRVHCMLSAPLPVPLSLVLSSINRKSSASLTVINAALCLLAKIAQCTHCPEVNQLISGID